jgi:hypothetical protein
MIEFQVGWGVKQDFLLITQFIPFHIFSYFLNTTILLSKPPAYYAELFGILAKNVTTRIATMPNVHLKCIGYLGHNESLL